MCIVKEKLKKSKTTEFIEKNECNNRWNEYPTADNLNDLKILQAEYDHHYEYKARGTTLR